MRNITLLSVLVLTWGFSFGSKFWEDKPYTEWTQEQAVSILMDSPWVQTRKLSVFSSRRIAGDRSTTELHYSVSFRSAKPTRMALARIAMLQGRFDLGQANRYIESLPFGGEVVIGVSVEPNQQLAELEKLTTEDLKESTYLLLDKSDRKIFLQRYIVPSESKTNEGLFLFPRLKEGISLSEKTIQFTTKLGRRVKLKNKFKLRDMVFDGNLEM